MTKFTTLYLCQNCGFKNPKWLGKCPDCNQWNTFAEETIALKSNSSKHTSQRGWMSHPTEPIRLNEVDSQSVARFSSGDEELDRLLGGGMVPGSLTLLGGDPGIGKSTLVLQVLGFVSKNAPVFYMSGEESPGQIRLRAERLGIRSENIFVFSENNLRRAVEFVEKHKPKLWIIDSIQTIFLPELESAPGSLTQVRECAAEILSLTKNLGVTSWLIGHVTKEGMLAGPKVLEHLVDTVLYFEGDKGLAYRLLRTTKNRFGSTNEVGVFEMTQAGLLPVQNPSLLFLSGTAESAPGSVVVSSLEGSRPLLVELQVLATQSNLAMPRRVASGIETNRLALLIAILEKNLKFSFFGKDVFANVVGGLKLNEPGIDLGIAMGLASSDLGVALPKATVFIGEVGLSGEVRPVGQTDLRLSEIHRLGFKRAIIAASSPVSKTKTDLEIITIHSLQEAVERWL